jgi:alkylation response protein AidB-like acyl-CoA dehydrogenase
VLSGTWSFASGCDASSWTKLGAFITPPRAKPPFEGAFFLLPIGDCEIVDNWFVCGLAGTGSKDIVVREVFVPAHRILLFSDARSGTAPGAEHHRNPLYRMPLLIHGASMLASTAVGAARGALDAYLEMTRTRKTRGALAGGQLPMVEFATIQLRYAEAAAAVESAELILLTDMRNMTQKLYAGQEITVADRIRCRRNQAWVTKLAVQAVEALNASTGGYGLHLSNPVQRAWRDANAVARHVSLNWDAVGTMYGQHAFGLEPRGQY